METSPRINRVDGSRYPTETRPQTGQQYSWRSEIDERNARGTDISPPRFGITSSLVLLLPRFGSLSASSHRFVSLSKTYAKTTFVPLPMKQSFISRLDSSGCAGRHAVFAATPVLGWPAVDESPADAECFGLPGEFLRMHALSLLLPESTPRHQRCSFV